MDLSFTRRSPLRADGPGLRMVARLDYARLVASVAAEQAATPTARAEARLSRAAATERTHALVALLAPTSGWTMAVTRLGGSFSPAHAAAHLAPRKGTLPPALPSHFSLRSRPGG